MPEIFRAGPDAQNRRANGFRWSVDVSGFPATAWSLGSWRVPVTGLCCWGAWAQVAEWLMAADCKSAAPWSYGGSNPPLCTMSCRCCNARMVATVCRCHREAQALRSQSTAFGFGPEVSEWLSCCMGFWRCWSGSQWARARCLVSGQPVELRLIPVLIIGDLRFAHHRGPPGG